MVWKATLTAIFLCTVTAPIAGEDSSTPIWRDLTFGDSPQVVIEKVKTITGVKSAELKSNKRYPDDVGVFVKYNGEGIDILGETFQIYPGFKGHQLNRIDLTGNQRCGDDAYDRYLAFLALLKGKYPQLLTREATQSDFNDAMAGAARGNEATGKTALSNGVTTVQFSQVFTRIEPPKQHYVTGRLGRAWQSAVNDNYIAAGGDCGGTGLIRVTFMMTYQRAQDYAADADGLADERARKQREASDNL